MITNLIKIKSGLILISKLIGIVLCIYYMYKVNDYQVSWKLLNMWMMPNWLVNINSVLSQLGTYILILPLSIIIVSLVIKSTTMNIMACLFSISGGIVSLTMSMTRGTLLEYSNFKLFVIYHAMALESKRAVFINEYKAAMITISKDVENKLAYLTENLDEKHFIVYDETLKILPVNELIINLEKNTPGILKRMGVFIWEGLTIQNIAITVGVVGVCFGGYKLISWLTSNNEALATGAQIQQEAAKVAAEGTVIQTASLDTTQAIVATIKELTNKSLVGLLGLTATHDKVITQLRLHLNKIAEGSELLAVAVSELHNRVALNQAELRKLWVFIVDLKKDGK
jgi:hypothetical protein